MPWLSKDPFDPDKCKTALVSEGSRYRAGINVWNIDITRLPIDVPLVESSIRKFREHYFAKPSVLPLDVVICVASAVQASELNKLRQLSPAEMLFAYVEAIALDIDKGDDETLLAWRSTMLACPARFVVMTGEDEIHKMCVQLREDISQNHATLRFSALQRMFDVHATIQRKTASTGPPTVASICEYYQGINQAATSEKISKEFVDCATTVLKRMWSIPKCQALLMRLEEMGTENPLDSIYKLHKVGGGRAPISFKFSPVFT